MSDGDSPLVIAATFFLDPAQERLFWPGSLRQLLEIADARAAAAWSDRIVLANSHDLVPSVARNPV
jgi:hypothetical protein